MPMRLGTPLPSLEGATGWLNQELQPADLAGRAVLVHFWAVSCHICHDTMPELMQYRDLFTGRLAFVAVHMPRQAEDVNEGLVKQDLDTYHMTQPVALDHEHRVAHAFQNEFVPAFFLFDAAHTLKFRAAGDKGFSSLRPKIEQLLLESVTPPL